MKKATFIIIGILVIAGLGMAVFSDKEEAGSEEKNMVESKPRIISADKKKKSIEAAALKGKNGEDPQLGLDISLKENDKGHSFTYEMMNSGDRDITLQYTTSQRYEYEIHRKNGGVVARYSDGKSFLQVLKDEPLKKGETVTVDITLPELGSGEYTLVVWSTAKGMNQSKQSIDFIIE